MAVISHWPGRGAVRNSPIDLCCACLYVAVKGDNIEFRAFA